MMDVQLNRLPRIWRILIALFVVVLLLGYSAGYRFLYLQNKFTTTGISQQYADGGTTSFSTGRNEQEILAVIHNHILAMSPLLLIMSALVLCSGLPGWLKKLLVIEPFVSLILTFGGIWLIWTGIHWMKMIVMISGMAMAISLYAQGLGILHSLWRKRNTAQSL